jgi:hypothetical protein
MWVLLIAMVVGLLSCEMKSSSQEETSTELSSKSPSEAVEDLVYLEDVSEWWEVLYGFENQGVWFPKLKETSGVLSSRGLNPGDLFFSDGPMKNRFQFIEMVERVEHNNRLNVEETIKYAIFEDQKAGRKGRRYEIPSRLPHARRAEFIHMDRAALLVVEMDGLESDSFKIEEGERFTLPKRQGDQEFLLKLVTPEEIVVEWMEGGRPGQKMIAITNRAKEPQR